MWATFLADVIAGIHLAYVGYVVVGLLLIYAGICLRWQWVRNIWFRASHLAMMAIVAVETVFDWKCPLTLWEEQLRGGSVRNGSFMGRLLFMFEDYPTSYFTAGYYIVTAIILATFFLAPPRFRRATPKVSEGPEQSAQVLGGTVP